MKLLVLLILVLFVAVPLVFSFLTYAFFWYETANGPHHARLREISRGRIGRLLLKGIASSSAAAVLVILLYPLGYMQRFRTAAPAPECPLPPVILVHGLYHNSSAWILYRIWLRRAGFRNVFVLNYNSFRCSFHDILERLDSLARDVASRFQGKPIVMIGHSLGGLVCRAYSERYDGVSIGAVVTIGTPHHGSKLAVLGIGRLAQSLAYRGPLIAELEYQGSHRDIPRLALYSVMDNMVLPNEALKPSNPEWTIQEVSPLSHVALLYHRKTAQSLMKFIQALQPVDRLEQKCTKDRQVPSSFIS